jgi:hypothetical protein
MQKGKRKSNSQSSTILGTSETARTVLVFWRDCILSELLPQDFLNSVVSLHIKKPTMLRMKDMIVNVSNLIQVVR